MFNTALLAKQAWRIVTKPEGLLARVLLGKYCKASPFLSVQPPKECSHGWRSILAGRDLLTLKLSAVIGNGESIKVWKDHWLSTVTPMTPYGPVLEKHQDLVVSDFLTREIKQWNIAALKEVFPLLVDTITLLKPSMTGRSDGVAWLGSRSGIYTTRSGYFAAAELEQQQTTTAQTLDWKKLIWTGRTSPKIKLFLWKITQGALPTGANLQQRGLLQHITCVRCGEVETESHLFLHCEYAEKIWSASLFKDQVNPSTCSEFLEALKLGKIATCLPPVGVVSDVFPWICWFIWLARNQLIFEKRFIEPEESLAKAIGAAREWNLAQPPPKAQPQRTNSRMITPDLDDLIVCYSDAAWKKESNIAAFGCIFKDKRGSTVSETSCVEKNVPSPLVAEALALRCALLTVISLDFSKICFKTDCQTLITVLTSTAPPADLYGIIQDIDHLSSLFVSVSFKFLASNFNSAADKLAKSALCTATSSIL